MFLGEENKKKLLSGIMNEIQLEFNLIFGCHKCDRPGWWEDNICDWCISDEFDLKELKEEKARNKIKKSKKKKDYSSSSSSSKST